MYNAYHNQGFPHRICLDKTIHTYASFFLREGRGDQMYNNEGFLTLSKYPRYPKDNPG